MNSDDLKRLAEEVRSTDYYSIIAFTKAMLREEKTQSLKEPNQLAAAVIPILTLLQEEAEKPCSQATGAGGATNLPPCIEKLACKEDWCKSCWSRWVWKQVGKVK